MANLTKHKVVHYRTPARQGTAKITAVLETARGLWYEIKDTVSGDILKVRAAYLVLA